MVEIEGASREQEEVLREILAGMAGTRIERLRVGSRTEPTGVAIELVRPSEPQPRTTWEANLVADAFRALSARTSMPAVVWFQGPGSGHILSSESGEPRQSLDRDTMKRHIVGAAALTGAPVDRLDVLEPYGLAAAVRLIVREPHAYLRHGVRAFLELSAHFDGRRAGSYVEIVDGSDERAWHFGLAGGHGMGGSRADVECCDPLFRGGIDDPGPPPCPVFG